MKSKLAIMLLVVSCMLPTLATAADIRISLNKAVNYVIGESIIDSRKITLK